MRGKDMILESFLSVEENNRIYKTYIIAPSNDNRERLDAQFKKHFYIVRCVSYFLKMIHFESRHFDKKQRELNKRYKLSLDTVTELGEKISDLIPDQQIPSCSGKELEHMINDPNLYSAILELTDRQRMLLNYIYVENMKNTEIATVLGISQQAVSKAKNKALLNLRKKMVRIV